MSRSNYLKCVKVSRKVTVEKKSKKVDRLTLKVPGYCNRDIPNYAGNYLESDRIVFSKLLSC